jgi:hypothetical protein
MTAGKRHPFTTALAALGLAVTVMLAGCANMPTESSLSSTDLSAPASLTYLDTDRFDENLSAKLQNKPPVVTVSFLDPPEVGEMPPRMNQWLAAVEENGGAIDLEGHHPDQKSAGTVLALVALVKEGHKMYKESRKFTPTQYYDVTVRLDDADDRVAHILFNLRETE